MKKLVFALALVLSTSAFADGYHGGHRGGYRGGNGWGPFIGGAIVGAVIYDIYNRPVVVQQPPVVVQQPPVIVQQPSGVACPYPYQPFYDRVWYQDQYGRSYPQDVFVGCR